MVEMRGRRRRDKGAEDDVVKRGRRCGEKGGEDEVKRRRRCGKKEEKMWRRLHACLLACERYARRTRGGLEGEKEGWEEDGRRMG